jgi:hypothetical protein
MASSMNASNSDGFLGLDHVYTVLPRTIKSFKEVKETWIYAYTPPYGFLI